MAVFVYVATSLDGFIAGPDDDLGWLDDIPNPGGSDFGFTAFMRRVDAIVLGRRTFDVLVSLGSWPYDKPVYVLSRTLNAVPVEIAGRAEIISGEPRAVVARLREQGHENLYVDGGVTVRSFLEADLIDEMIITRVPILLGEGIPLFGQTGPKREFAHVKTETLNDLLTKSYYIRVRT
jgi:dihydrofolate reductase